MGIVRDVEHTARVADGRLRAPMDHDSGDALLAGIATSVPVSVQEHHTAGHSPTERWQHDGSLDSQRDHTASGALRVADDTLLSAEDQSNRSTNLEREL